jgi:enterochelin esterase family protein
LIELPNAPAQPWIEVNPDAPSGELVSETIRSEILDEDRQITVYTPPGYDGKGKPAGLIIVFDAGVYGANEGSTLVPTPTILDNLINSGKIDAMVALLVHNTDRTRDLACSENFAGFLATELVPWARNRFHVAKSASRTMVAGSSFGGLISACAALYYPKIFGQVLSQSGSFWYVPGFEDGLNIPGLPTATNWVADQFKEVPQRSTRFYMDVGSFEGPGQVATNRHLRDVLLARGYEVTYREFNGGHDYVCWRGTLADGLLALAGTGGGR